MPPAPPLRNFVELDDVRAVELEQGESVLLGPDGLESFIPATTAGLATETAARETADSSEASTRAAADTAETERAEAAEAATASGLSTHEALTTGAHGGIVATDDARLGGTLLPLAVDPRTRWLGQSILSALIDGRSLGLAFLSDSTADNPTDWSWLLGTMIGADFPGYTVEAATFTDATQSYPAATVIQGDIFSRYMRFVTGASHSLEIKAADVTTPPTNIDFAVQVGMDTWVPATVMTLAAHSGSSGNLGWEFILNTNGKLGFSFSTNGTSFTTIQSSVATGFSASVKQWVRVQFQPNDGSGNHVTKFFYSADGFTWTQLGSTSTVSGTVTLFASTYNYEIGARDVATQVCTGNFYRVRFLSTIDAALNGSIPAIAPIFPEWWGAVDSSSPSPTGNPVLKLSVGCVAGEGLAYLSDTTRLPILLPDYNNRAVFMATSHNDSDLIGPNYLANWKTWITNVQSYAWLATPVIVTENPIIAPRSPINNDRQRRWLQLGLAQRLGLPSIDAYAAFLDGSGNVMNSYIASDGEHPTATGAGDGMHLWASAAHTALFGS